VASARRRRRRVNEAPIQLADAGFTLDLDDAVGEARTLACGTRRS
jgi:hypothetical protein